MFVRLLTLLVFLVASIISPFAFAQTPDTATVQVEGPLAERIQARLQNPQNFKRGYDLQRLYQDRQYQPIWLEANGNWQTSPTTYADAIVERAYKEGLNPENYRIRAGNGSVSGASLASIAQTELEVTDTIMDFIGDLRYGAVDPETVFPMFFAPDRSQDIAWLTQEFLSSRNLDDAFEELAPPMEEYAQLRAALAEYRVTAASGGWEHIPSGGLIKPGGVDTRIPLIRQRLQQLGKLEKDYEGLFGRVLGSNPFNNDRNEQPNYSKVSENHVSQARENPEWIYRYDMEPIIKEFQRRRGAKVDGVIGPETIAELNVPIEERINQIRLSMEQWRWLPRDMGKKYVFVNTAGYYALAVENGDVKVRTPVIVGEAAHETPSFSSKIYNVKFYPDWTVPESITHRYLIKKIQNNPAVVQTLGYELYHNGTPVALDAATIANLQNLSYPPYRFRQRPGSNNALGLVRFSVINDYAIYLHDTSNPDLFDANDRNFSSGCIRVEEKERMAQFLLNPEGYSDAEVEAKFQVAGRTDLSTQVIPLKENVPVHIMYMTAWIDENGHVRFEGDVYGRDAKLKQAMGL